MIETFLSFSSAGRDGLASLQLQARAWALKSSLLASEQRYDEAYVHMLHATQLDPTNRRFAATLTDLTNIRDASHFFGVGGRGAASRSTRGDSEEWVEIDRD